MTTGFDRPNLSFAVVPCRGVADKRARLAAALKDEGERPAIVYAGTRAETEDLAVALEAALGVEVLAYHAGLDRGERADGQRRFMSGEVEVVDSRLGPPSPEPKQIVAVGLNYAAHAA